jgi:sulfate permease, SulP family
VLVLNILYGVLLAVGLSVADMLRRVARPHDGVLGFVPGLAGMHDVDDYPQATTVPGLVVYRYDSPLFFANAENFHRPRWRPSTGSGSRCAGSCSTYGLTARIGAERIYPTLPTAVAAYEKWRAEHDAG